MTSNPKAVTAGDDLPIAVEIMPDGLIVLTQEGEEDEYDIVVMTKGQGRALVQALMPYLTAAGLIQ